MSPKKQDGFRLDDEVRAAMAHVKETERISKNDQIDLAIREWLEKRGALRKKGGRKKR
jgi:hypothetical protein